MRHFSWALLLACTACAGVPSAPAPPAVVACQEGVYNDPAVKELIEIGVGSQYFMNEHQEGLKAAKADATLRCLQSRGLAPLGGGVERPKVAN